MPSTRRIFSDAMYEEAGAELTSDISEATIVLGVKQPLLADLKANRAYMFFSHTAKVLHSSGSMLDSSCAMSNV